MKPMKYLLSLIILILVGCTICGTGEEGDSPCFPWSRKKGYTRCDDGTVYKRLTYDIQDVAFRFKKERRLKLEDSNFWYNGELQKIRLDFSTMELLDLCEARFLLVDLVEDLIKTLKKDEVLMAGLYHPKTIDPDIIEIYIDFKCYFGRYIDFEYIGWISMEEGCVNYYAFDMRTDRLDWWQRRSEPYIESRTVVMATREAEEAWNKAHQEKPGPLEEERFRFEPNTP